MPGIHFVHANTGEAAREQYSAQAGKLLHDRGYVREIVYQDETTWLGVTRYGEYPVAVMQNDDYLILLEGRLHCGHGTGLRDDLMSLAGHVFDHAHRNADGVRDWLLERDGDFILMLHDKASGRWAFLNDALGRLPVYFHEGADGQCCLSREIRFVAGVHGSARVDRMAVAQYLLFGFPWGVRTLLDGVDRLPPATLIRWSGRGERAQRRALHQFCFGERQEPQPISETAAHLVSLFIAACRVQADRDRRCVLSLSGGHDSRAVAAGLLKAGVSFAAMTFEDAFGAASRDVLRARQLADRLELDWHLVRLNTPTGRELQHILRIKGGLNSLASALAVPFMREIDSRFGRNITYFSGDGGDHLLPNVRPARRLPSVSHLAAHIVARYQVMSPEQVAGLTGVRTNDIMAELEGLMSSYPERSANQKYVHHIHYERGMRWLFEGEDCNRCHFWCSTPFYSLPFFRAAMNCPDKQKKNHRLYREFLGQLSPMAIRVADANRGVAISTFAFRQQLALGSLLGRYPGIMRRVKEVLRPPGSYAATSSTVNCLRRQVANCKPLAEPFSRRALKEILDRPDRLSREALDNLLTVTSAMAMFTGAEDTLQPFADSEFS